MKYQDENFECDRTTHCSFLNKKMAKKFEVQSYMILNHLKGKSYCLHRKNKMVALYQNENTRSKEEVKAKKDLVNNGYQR